MNAELDPLAPSAGDAVRETLTLLSMGSFDETDLPSRRSVVGSQVAGLWILGRQSA